MHRIKWDSFKHDSPGEPQYGGKTLRIPDIRQIQRDASIQLLCNMTSPRSKHSGRFKNAWDAEKRISDWLGVTVNFTQVCVAMKPCSYRMQSNVKFKEAGKTWGQNSTESVPGFWAGWSDTRMLEVEGAIRFCLTSHQLRKALVGKSCVQAQIKTPCMAANVEHSLPIV